MDVSQFGLFDPFGARPRWTDGPPDQAPGADALDANPADTVATKVAPIPQHGAVVVLSAKRPRYAFRRLQVGGT